MQLDEDFIVHPFDTSLRFAEERIRIEAPDRAPNHPDALVGCWETLTGLSAEGWFPSVSVESSSMK